MLPGPQKWPEREAKHYLPVELRPKMRGDLPPYPDVSTYSAILRYGCDTAFTLRWITYVLFPTSLAVVQDGHLQRVTIPEAYVQFTSLTS